jgi:hypothetical protein
MTGRRALAQATSSSARRHSAGYCFVPDCERVRVNGGAAPRVLLSGGVLAAPTAEPRLLWNESSRPAAASSLLLQWATGREPLTDALARSAKASQR